MKAFASKTKNTERLFVRVDGEEAASVKPRCGSLLGSVGSVAVIVLGLMMAGGCDQQERVVALGHKAREETKRDHERQFSDEGAEEGKDSQQAEREALKSSLQAERDALDAVINGKLAVLSNRIATAEAAIRELQIDRAAFSKELGVSTGGAGAACGTGLERSLASPIVNAIAMKYLKMDFSVTRGEYAEALAKARACEAQCECELKRLDETFHASVDPNPQAAPAARRSETVASLERELKKLEVRRTRLTHETIPTGSIYNNRRTEHERDVRTVENRIRELERMIDQLRTGDENERKTSDRTARFVRDKALAERNRAVEKLKREYATRPTVLQTVQTYTEKTLRRLEQALVKEAATREGLLLKSREGHVMLKGMAESVPRLSVAGAKKLQSQVQAL